MTHFRSHLRPVALIVAVSLYALLSAGCLAALIADRIAGPAVHKAHYILPKSPTLILVETYTDAPRGDLDADRLGHAIADDLTDHKAATIVDLDLLNHVRDADPAAYPKLTIAEIGRAVGAKQVIYVDVRSYTLDAPVASQEIHGSMVCRVKVVSAETGQSLWPADSVEGEPITASSDYSQQDPHGVDTSAKLDLNDAAAEQIGRMFYDWQPQYDTDNSDQ